MTQNNYTPTDLRALAARVAAEEPSEELREAVLVAIGWTTDGVFWSWGDGAWCSPSGEMCARPPNPLTSHDAAFGAMPAGWRVSVITQDDDGFRCVLYSPPPVRFVSADCSDIPRAVTAAGLLARAAEMEQGDKS